ncbi:MAG: hypothetical protein KJ077_24665 [Anaerolineae bacterium]|nr:hypothetical protein [Anaerolineae bacterium]
MPESPEAKIREIFEVLKVGLGPYVLNKYRTEYNERFEQEFRTVIRDFRRLSFDNDDALCQSIDTQGWLDLILKRRNIFLDDLNYLGLAYTSELMDFRNKIAHEELVSYDDAYRATDTVARLLEIINSNDLAEVARIVADELLTELYEQRVEVQEFNHCHLKTRISTWRSLESFSGVNDLTVRIRAAETRPSVSS